MHRGLVLCLVALLMVSAGVASAETYLGLRFGGNGNFEYADGGPMCDSGWFTHREFAVGFGDEIQGEVSLGWNSWTESYDPSEGGSREDVEMSWSGMHFGVAGFYPMMEGSSYRVDVGGRFQYHTGSMTSDNYIYRDGDYEVKLSGWTIGPVMRGSWWLGDLPLTFGPEVFVKYSSLTYTDTCEDCWDYETDVSAFGIDYGFRLDFHFD